MARRDLTVIYNVPTLTARLQVVVNAIDATGNGFMRLSDGGGNLLTSFQLSNPMGVASNGVLTFNGLSLIDPSAAGSGQAAAGRCETATGTVIISGLTVGGPGSTADIVLSPNTTIIAGQTVAVTAASIQGD